MGFFRASRPAVRPRVEQRYTFNELGLIVASQQSGVATVTDPDSALRHSAVWACVDVLAGSVASLPVTAVYERDQIRVPVVPTPSLLAAPSATTTLDVWLYQIMWSMLLDGNAFGLITATDSSGRPTSIELLDAAKVSERVSTAGVATVDVAGMGVTGLYPRGDVWHVPGKMTRPGSPFAMSPLWYAGRTIAAGLAAEGFMSQFFTDGATPSAIISTDETIDRDEAVAIKAAFREATTGNRDAAVFGSGLKYEQVSVNPDEAQPVELLRFNVEQVCRFFRVPPSMVYGAISGENITYANVSQSDLHYLKHSLSGYLTRIERAMSDLIPRPQVVKFNRDALLAADTMTRYEAHAVALTAGFLTVDEVRTLEDRPPLPEDDIVVEPAAEPFDPTMGTPLPEADDVAPE